MHKKRRFSEILRAFPPYFASHEGQHRHQTKELSQRMQIGRAGQSRFLKFCEHFPLTLRRNFGLIRSHNIRPSETKDHKINFKIQNSRFFSDLNQFLPNSEQYLS